MWCEISEPQQVLPVRSFFSFLISLRRSSNFTWAAWKKSWGSGRGNTLLSVPACWSSEADINTFECWVTMFLLVWSWAIMTDGNRPCQSYVGSIKQHNPPDESDCPEEGEDGWLNNVWQEMTHSERGIKLRVTLLFTSFSLGRISSPKPSAWPLVLFPPFM